MRAHPKDVTLNTTVCWALANLLHNAEQNRVFGETSLAKQVLLHPKDLQYIVRLLEKFQHDERFAEYCCRLLGELTKGPTSDKCSPVVLETRRELKRNTELVKLLLKIRENGEVVGVQGGVKPESSGVVSAGAVGGNTSGSGNGALANGAGGGYNSASTSSAGGAVSNGNGGTGLTGGSGSGEGESRFSKRNSAYVLGRIKEVYNNLTK